MTSKRRDTRPKRKPAAANDDDRAGRLLEIAEEAVEIAEQALAAYASPKRR